MFTDKVKSWLLDGVIAALCVGLLYTGFQVIDGRNKHIEDQDRIIVALQNENTQLKIEAVNKVKSDAVTEEVKTVVKQAETKPAQVKTLAQQYVDNKLADIDKKYAELPQSAINDERKRTEVSLERAKGLWLTYCLQEPQYVACK